MRTIIICIKLARSFRDSNSFNKLFVVNGEWWIGRNALREF